MTPTTMPPPRPATVPPPLEPCSAESHARAATEPARWMLELHRHRPWPETELEIADCLRCGSTLGRAAGDR